MTKGDKLREVFFVNEEARTYVLTYLRTRSLRHMDAPLFRTQRGGHFSANSMQRLVAICYGRVNVRGSSHSGRRSYAIRLIEHGADIYAVKELLGHSSIVTHSVLLLQLPRAVEEVRRHGMNTKWILGHAYPLSYVRTCLRQWVRA